MNLIKTIAVFLAMVGASGSVWAHRPVHYFQPRVSVGIVTPLYQPHYRHHRHRAIYYPYAYSWPYYAPVVIAPTVSYLTPVVTSTVYPVTEVQQVYINSNNYDTYNRPHNTGNDWLYCRQPDGFYPAIKSCPSGWQHVPAQAPR